MTTAIDAYCRARHVADLLNRQAALYRSRNWIDDAPYFKHAPSFVQLVNEHYGPCPHLRVAYVEYWGEQVATVIPLTGGMCLMQVAGQWFACDNDSAATVAQGIGASETVVSAA